MDYFTGLFKKVNNANRNKNVLFNVKNNTGKNMELINVGFKQTPNQTGGVAPVNFEYPANMRQPSDKVMEWATTAGLPTPTTGMRNVAHGGSRKNKSRKNKTRKDKSRKNKSRKNKSRKNKSRKNKSRKDKSRKDKSRKDKSRK